ncbi:UPF0187-domain-containing protein [Lepidopterella palustris CBS 459.81]|uniref:UPF0187-domain-containing protein n=1 Tax=Lepidopterella palustris CBS 459.81 TaxID=1314670 RepID=A0A8E2E6Z2_9PEZI|nr:UPF0187-domain-containing protein [Lepidopterella palustris CBS 459.81]
MPMSPTSWRQPVMRKVKTGSIYMDDYFTGPRDMSRHSKWPFFMRMHGSVAPKMILPLLIVACWATFITVFSQFVFKLKVSNLLLTVLGFVVGMAISFRTSTAYERYAEGRKYWAQLLFVGQNLARTIWVHAKEREGEQGKEDLLAKLTGLNLIVAFANALKHKLRFEPGINYDDLHGLVEYLDTFSKAAEPDLTRPGKTSVWKSVGEYLGVPFAESNPRKLIKRSKKPLGNLPLEILTHLSAYVDSLIDNSTLKVPIYQTQAVNSIVSLNEILIGTDRVLQTPLPIAYSITFSQITWVYVMMLPFQLWDSLRWVTIPGTIFAAYIILGIAAIGREIENPFGMDVNDLPLDSFCDELAADINIITSAPAPVVSDFVARGGNMVMWPLSLKGWDEWKDRTKQDIREALMTKTKADMVVRRSVSEEVAEKKNFDDKNVLQEPESHA